MDITVTQAQGQVPVSIITPQGALDASSYRTLIEKAEQLQASGERYLLIDMGKITFMSSAGLVGLHTISLMLRGEKMPELESGWESFKKIDRDRETGKQKYLKILNPSPNVNKILTMSGFNNLLEIHTELEEAVASFDL